MSGVSKASEGPTGDKTYKAFPLNYKERNYIAGHALDSIHRLSEDLARLTHDGRLADPPELEASSVTRRIAALSNLLSDTGWERERTNSMTRKGVIRFIGGLFPVAQLRPWLEEWQFQAMEAFFEQERELRIMEQCRVWQKSPEVNPSARRTSLSNAIAQTEAEFCIGSLLSTRVKTWMDSHEK